MPSSTESSPVASCKAEDGICVNGENTPCAFICLEALVVAADCIAKAGVITRSDGSLGYSLDHGRLDELVGENTNG